ncbi:MAG: hypothetical protein ACO1ON_05395, partial [Nocardioides sp.]
ATGSGWATGAGAPAAPSRTSTAAPGGPAVPRGAPGWPCPPAVRALAAQLAGSLRDAPGCTELTDVPSYGARSVAVACDAGRGTRVVRAGVLGDAWLGCSLDGGRGVAAEEVERRSDAWCAGLLVALDGTSAPTQ